MRSRLFLLLMLVAGVLQAENALLPFAEGEWKIDAASRVATVSSGGSEFTVVFQVTADLADPFSRGARDSMSTGLKSTPRVRFVPGHCFGDSNLPIPLPGNSALNPHCVFRCLMERENSGMAMKPAT